MLDRQAATARLTREMNDAEDSISIALINATALLHSCAIAAHDNKVISANVQAAFLRTQKTASRLLEARAEAARTHGALVEVYREVAGTEEPYPCPEPTAIGGEIDERLKVA